MEFNITCPECGKVHKISITEANAPEITLTSKCRKTTTWEDVAKEIRSGNSTLEIGDEIACILKNGTEVVFVAAALNPYANNEVAFVIKDCLPSRERCINETGTNVGGWGESELKEYLDKDVYALLPDDLQAVIKPRKIWQRQDNKAISSQNKLWCLSRTELFGGVYPADVDDVHFPLFSDERSRVKQIDGETEWYWTRTPCSGITNVFVFVNTSGTSDNGLAHDSYGVAFGFLI